MSRVDEALNRATGGERVEGGLARPSTRGAVTVGESIDGAFADYPHERERVERLRPVRHERTSRGASQPPRLTSSQTPSFHFDRTTEGKVVVDRETSPVPIEQYRRLAATLHGLQVSSGLHTVMVSSALPRDGKTLTTTNLALTLSESYKRRVLVIDADLRRPSIHKVFGLENKAGLAEGLRSEGNLSVFQVSTTLAVLPAGSPDVSPMAGLASERMAAVLKAASMQFDWILLDSPPIGLISDARLLADLVDGVLLVVGAGSTDHAAIAKTVQEVGRERILGVVLNRVRTEISSADHYDGYYLRTDAQKTGPNQ